MKSWEKAHCVDSRRNIQRRPPSAGTQYPYKVHVLCHEAQGPCKLYVTIYIITAKRQKTVTDLSVDLPKTDRKLNLPEEPTHEHTGGCSCILCSFRCLQNTDMLYNSVSVYITDLAHEILQKQTIYSTYIIIYIFHTFQ